MQGNLLRGGQCRRSAGDGRGGRAGGGVGELPPLHDPGGHRGRGASGLHGGGPRRRLHDAAGRRCRVRLLLRGERHHLLLLRPRLEGGENLVPQADLLPPLPHPAGLVLQRLHRIELPPVGGVPPGLRVREAVGNPGLPGPEGAYRPPFRRGFLPPAGGCGRSAGRKRRNEEKEQ